MDPQDLKKQNTENNQFLTTLNNIQPPVNPVVFQQVPPQPVQPSQPTNQAIVADAGKDIAILGLVLAFVIPVVGIVVSAIARHKSKKCGYNNKLALGGLIASIIFTVIGILAVSSFAFGVISSLPSNIIVGEWKIANADNDTNQVMVFDKEGDYFWYKDGDDREDNYYYGSYVYELGNKTNDSGQLSTNGGETLYTLTLTQNGVKTDNGAGDRSGENIEAMFLGVISDDYDEISMANTNGSIYELEKIK